MKKNTKKLVMTALLTALVCVATMVIRIPTPATSGYIHPGDAMVILAGVFLGPVYGFAAAGIGSSMADLLGGYFIYIPITFFIKGFVALGAGFLYQKMDKTSVSRYIAVAFGGIFDIACVALGYFVCEAFLYGPAGAFASVPANLIQGFSGLIIALALYPILHAVPEIRKIRSDS